MVARRQLQVEVVGPLIQRVRLSPLLGLLLQPFDIGVELATVDPPYPPATKLDPRQLTGSHERVGLRSADVQVRRDVLESEEAGFDTRGPATILSGFLHSRNRTIPMRRFLGFPVDCARLPLLAVNRPGRRG
jgi:hypothetical protein